MHTDFIENKGWISNTSINLFFETDLHMKYDCMLASRPVYIPRHDYTMLWHSQSTFFHVV